MSYPKIGIISCIIVLIGSLGIILQSFVPNLEFVFSSLFYLGIFGVTITFYSYALHLYQFNSRIISNLTLSSVIVLYLMSFNVVSYSAVVQLILSGILGWFIFALYLMLIFAGSWTLLYVGESLRIAIFSDKDNPTLKKKLPGVSGAFAMMFIVIAFLSVNFLIASGAFSYSDLNWNNFAQANNDSGQSNLNNPNNPPLVNLLQDYFTTQINPTVDSGRGP